MAASSDAVPPVSAPTSADSALNKAGSMCISVPNRLDRDLLLNSRIEPDRHARFEASRIVLQIEAQTQSVAVVTANRTLGLPGRECPQRAQLGDQSRRFLRCA